MAWVTKLSHVIYLTEHCPKPDDRLIEDAVRHVRSEKDMYNMKDKTEIIDRSKH